MTQEPKEPVMFEIKIKSGIDGNSVKKNLEQLAADMTIHVLELKNLKMQYVSGTTTQDTYEKVFGAKLEYITKTIPNLNRGPRQVQEWKEMTPATVPAGLDDKIEYIRLALHTYLTD